MKQTLISLFDLHHDQADPHNIEKMVRQGVRVGGTNLWVLIFAILIASIGLNVNSTAVIIGAMLISPLMGPIIAVGYGVATNDSELIRTAIRNLALFAGISLLASFLYFKVSPLSQAHSELLARTTPTLWDVLIAFFGGAAGIVALTRRQASPVIPGVAIATALMPPLCTAGYGLATANFAFFGGAFYLFAINCVFIALATALFVNLMRLPQHPHATPDLQRRTRLWISVLLVAMIVPSTWLGYRLVREELFNRAAHGALDSLSERDGGFELSRTILPKQRTIRITLGGDLPAADLQDRLVATMRAAGFDGVTVDVRYLGTAGLVREFNQDIEGVYQKTLSQLQDNNRLMQSLSAENQRLRSELSRRAGLEAEVLAQYPALDSVLVADGMRKYRSADSTSPAKTLQVTLFSRNGGLKQTDLDRLRAWLAIRFPEHELVLLQARPMDLVSPVKEVSPP